MMVKYTTLPEWLRWILAAVLTPFVAVAVGYCYVRFVLPTAPQPGGQQIITHAFHPALVEVCTLWALYFLVPRAKRVFVWTVFVLRSLVPLVLLVGAALHLAGVEAYAGINLGYGWLKEFLGEIIAFTVSTLAVTYLSREE